MSANAPGTGDDRPAKRSSEGSAVRRPTAWLAALGVVALLAAAFALSYGAFVALARAGGVDPRLARFYPGVFDATLVVTFAALFVLRTARVYVRLLTWLSAILVLAVCAAAGAAHAAQVHIPVRPLAAAVAIAPFLLLVLAFRLWLTMLRHIRRGGVRRRGKAEPALPEYVPPEPHAVERGTRSAPPLALPPAVPAAAPEPARESVDSPARQAVAAEQDTYDRAEPEGAVYEDETPDAQLAGADGEHGMDVRDEWVPAAEPREPTLEDLAAVVDLAELGEPVASLEPDEDDLDENRPPLPRRQRTRVGGEIGEEDELVADDGPMSDPVTDEAEPADGLDDDPADGVADELARANEADELDEFAELEVDPDDVPPPPSHRVRSSPLPPLDWGPGLGGLTGRRRTPRANGGSDTVV